MLFLPPSMLWLAISASRCVRASSARVASRSPSPAAVQNQIAAKTLGASNAAVCELQLDISSEEAYNEFDSTVAAAYGTGLRLPQVGVRLRLARHRWLWRVSSYVCMAQDWTFILYEQEADAKQAGDKALENSRLWEVKVRRRSPAHCACSSRAELLRGPPQTSAQHTLTIEIGAAVVIAVAIRRTQSALHQVPLPRQCPPVCSVCTS
jgi:hypothetical protein